MSSERTTTLRACSAETALALVGLNGRRRARVAVAVSLGGMFVTALLLGIVSEQITEKVEHRAGKESEIPNFKGSYLGRFSLVSADFWTSDHLLERSRSMDVFSVTRARGTLTLKRS